MLLINTCFLILAILYNNIRHIIGFSTAVVISCFLIYIRNKIGKYLETLVTFYFATWIAFTVYTILPDHSDSSQRACFFLGGLLAVLQNIVLYRLSQIPLMFLFTIYGVVCKGLLLYFYSVDEATVNSFILNIILDISSLLNKLIHERHERKTFVQIYMRSEGSEKFKSFVNKHLPDALLIVKKDGCEKLYSNQAFQKLLTNQSQTYYGYQELLKASTVESDLFGNREVTGSLTSLRPISNGLSLYEFLMRGLELKVFDEGPVCLQICLDENVCKKVLEVKIFTMLWDKDEAIVIVLSDITQQETMISLKLADKHTHKVLATLSHELKTPLNGILGIVHVLKKKMTERSFQEMLDICQNNANLLLNIVNSMLDLHMLRNKKIRLYIEKVNICQLMEDVRVLFAYQCRKKGLKLTVKISPVLPEIITTDKARLSEILINLAVNAVKFTYKGKITLGVDVDTANPQNIMFWVEDTGIGIKEEAKPKLFKMYGKSQESTGSHTDGIGLGLAVSYSLVRLLNCNKNECTGLQVESQHKKGSRFYFSISQDLSLAQHKDGSISVLGSSINEDNVIDEKLMPYSTTIRSITLKSRNQTPSILSPSLINPSLLGSPTAARKGDGNRLNWHRPAQIDLESSLANRTDMSKEFFNHTSSRNSRNSLIDSGSNDSSLRVTPGELESPKLPSEHSDNDLNVRGKRRAFRARTSIFKKDARDKSLNSTNKPKSILVVDDNPFNLLIVQRLIQDSGVEVKTALNGKEAIEKAKEEAALNDRGFRFILMDLQMPVMDGFEATRSLVLMMNMGKIPESPIIALTANDADDDVEMCLNVGMKAHLAKPLKPENLAKIMEQYL